MSQSFNVSLDGVWSTDLGARRFPMADSPPGLIATHHLVLPAAFDRSSRVILHATGIGWRVRVRIGTTEIANDAGGTRPIAMDISGKLAPGDNKIGLQIEAPGAESSAYTYSMPRRGHVLVRGEAWLEITGSRHIDDLNVQYDKGALHTSATVTGAEGEAVHFTVVRDGRALADLGEGTVESGVARASGPWRGPLWTLGGSSSPFLEYLVATLPDGTSRQVRFGARSVTRRDRGLALNGEPTYLAVQRHEPARVDVRSDLAMAATAYAAAGLNALELHGAVYGHTLLDAADELGFPVALTPRCDGRRRDDGPRDPDAAWAAFIEDGNARIVEAWNDHPSVLLWNLEANEEPGFPDLYAAFRATAAPFVDTRESHGYGDVSWDQIRSDRPLTPFIEELAFHLGNSGTELTERLAPLLRKHRSFGIGITLPHVLYSRGGDVSAAYAAQYAASLAPILHELDVPPLPLGERRGIATVEVSVTRAANPAEGEVVILRAPGHPPVATATDEEGKALISLDYSGPATVEVWGGASQPVTLSPGRYRAGRWEPRTAEVALAE